jgi:hypothetical protein
MRTPKPLTDEDGEVRELTVEDIKRFRPIREVLSASSLRKLGLAPGEQLAEPTNDPGRRGSKIMGKREAIYRALLDQPCAADDAVARLADRYAGTQVSLKVVSDRRGELRWMLRELDSRGWLTSEAAEQIKPLTED